jgi:hypothetical protein
MTATAERPIRVGTARVGLGRRLLDIWRYHELLVAFTRTEFKVKCAQNLFAVIVVPVRSFPGALLVFRRAEGNLAEEL